MLPDKISGIIVPNSIVVAIQIMKLQREAASISVPSPAIPESEKPGPFRVKRLLKLNNAIFS